jgi:hypothetical protein
LSRHERFERVNGRGIEAAHVPIGRIETGHDAAAQPDEQRIRREGFEPEDAKFAHDEQVDQQAELDAHDVDRPVADLEMVEERVEHMVDTQPAQVGAEPHQACNAGQIGVGLAGVNGPRVRSANAARALIPIPALAAKDVPARLVEDRELLRRLGAAVSTTSGAPALGLLPMFADLSRPWHVGRARRVAFGGHYN